MEIFSNFDIVYTFDALSGIAFNQPPGALLMRQEIWR